MFLTWQTTALYFWATLAVRGIVGPRCPRRSSRALPRWHFPFRTLAICGNDVFVALNVHLFHFKSRQGHQFEVVARVEYQENTPWIDLTISLLMWRGKFNKSYQRVLPRSYLHCSSCAHRSLWSLMSLCDCVESFLVALYIGCRSPRKRKFYSGVGKLFLFVEGPWGPFCKSQGLFFYNVLEFSLWPWNAAYIILKHFSFRISQILRCPSRTFPSIED